MGVNHVELSNGETVVDLRQDTINPDVVLEGYTGHDAQGNPFDGRLQRAGGEAVQEVMFVTADFSFATLEVSNISHTYNEVFTALDENKIVKMFVSYTLPGVSGQNIAIGEVTAIVVAQSIIKFALFVKADLGAGPQLYQFEVNYRPNGIGTVISQIQTG